MEGKVKYPRHEWNEKKQKEHWRLAWLKAPVTNFIGISVWHVSRVVYGTRKSGMATHHWRIA
jgi:hypothetical protein